MICVEIDLSKFLSDCIHLKHENIQWTEVLYYDNMAFRYCICFQIEHLQNTCQLVKNIPKKKMRQARNPKAW